MNRNNYRKMGVPRFLAFFEKFYMAAAMISIFVMMLSISADALSRYLFGSPITGQYEFTQFYLLVILVFMALPRTYIIGGHIRLNLLDGYRRKIPFNLSERCNAALAGIAFGAIAWVSGLEAIDKFVSQDKLFGAVQFPIYWSYVWVPLGSGLMALRLIYEIFFPVTHSDPDSQQEGEL
jgi:TRAP-type C4-dicarboxylate transport system permease small subunit